MFGTPREFNFQEGVPAAEFSFVGADSGSAEYRKRAVEAAIGMTPPQSSQPVTMSPQQYFQPAPDVFSMSGFGAPVGPGMPMVMGPPMPRSGGGGFFKALAIGAGVMGLIACWRRNR